MEYNRIVAVTGMPGLYEVVSSKTDGAIVRSLEDQSTRFVSSRIHNLSHLESIEVYTVRDNVQLSDIFAAMKAGSVALPDVKDNKALKAYFEKVYPDLDFERVYASDMKKMVKWFEVFHANNIDFTPKPEEPAEEAEPVKEVVAEEEPPVEKTPAKKTARSASGASKTRAKKETAPKKESNAASAEAEEKAKRGRKKKTEE